MEEAGDMVTVSFDSRGGAAVRSVSLVRGGTLGGKYPTPASRDGFVFNGWYDGFTECTRDTEIFTDLKLAAHWQDVYVTVTFNSAGGEPDFPPVLVPKGGVLGVRFPGYPRLKGNVIQNWTYKNEKGEDAVLSKDTPVTADITATAKWRQLTEFTVTFDSGENATPVDPIKVYQGECIDEWEDRFAGFVPEYQGDVSPPAKGLAFRDWVYDPAGQNTIYTGRTPITRNVTLVARWRYVIDEETFTIDLSKSLNAEPNHELLNYPLPAVSANPGGGYVYTFTERNSAIAIETPARFRELMMVANSLTVEVDGQSDPESRIFRLLIGDTITYAEGWNSTKNLEPTLVPLSELRQRDLVIEETNLKNKPETVNYVFFQTNRGLDNQGIEQLTVAVIKSIKITVR
jgi:uncharacterized repeat protein (TIGR02543 family)